MYLSFYGLREAPFAPTPDPKFLFQSPRHREALAQLIYGVRERKGFIVLTGEIGTGKTTLLRTLLERLDATTPVAYVHNSALNIEGLLEYILQDWGVKSEAQTHAQRLFEPNEFLIDQHKKGSSPVLVIDEAQNLSVPTLEAVRLLSNFETTSQKLMQILLVGQPELRDKLNLPELRQLKQRVGLRCHIAALSPEETRQYIRHRLRIAGATAAPVAEPPAEPVIAPRREAPRPEPRRLEPRPEPKPEPARVEPKPEPPHREPPRPDPAPVAAPAVESPFKRRPGPTPTPATPAPAPIYGAPGRENGTTFGRRGVAFAVVPAGTASSMPYELLKSPRLASLLAALRDRFDYVVLDTPPVLPYPDVGILRDLVDGFVVVVRANRTPREMLRDCMNVVGRQRGLGVIFNDDERSTLTTVADDEPSWRRLVPRTLGGRVG